MATKYRAQFGLSMVAIAAITSLSGCSFVRNTVDAVTPDLQRAEFSRSSFASTDLDGYVVRQLADITQLRVRDEVGIGYAYKGGLDTNGDYNTLVGINNVDRLTPPTFQGAADFTGEARAVYANVNRLFASSSVQELASPITIRANLDTGFFEGATQDTTNSTLDLRVSGTIQNGTMTGTGQFQNRTVEIDTVVNGNIGQNKAVAIFHGAGTAVSVAGGIYVTR
ncbi:MAG: hypothetical protein AAF891_08605 [Pseudomonadota bacterium]